MKYVVVESGNRLVLMSEVNDRIKEGYTPIGGVSVVIRKGAGRTLYHFYQAMIKKE